MYYYPNPNYGIPRNQITYEYDDQGKMTKETNTKLWVSQAVPGSYNTYEYQNGLLYKKSIFTGDSRGTTFVSHYIYTYENKKLTRHDYYDEHGTKTSSRHYVFARNRLIHIYSIGMDGYKDEYKFYYDLKGRRIKEESSAIVYKSYDDQDRVLTQKIFESEEVLYSSTEYKYQQNQENPSEEVTYDKDNVFVRRIYWTYTPEGHVLEKWYEDATGKHPWELNTFQNGVITQKSIFDPIWNFSEVTKTRYEYESL